MKVFIVLAFCTLALGANIKPHRRTPTLDSRIVGGQDTSIEDLPYQLSLLSYYWLQCGASIISANWALTAAHCVYDSKPREWRLRAGTNTSEQGGSYHKAAEVIWHPQFDISTYDYDFALIRVAEPFPLGQLGVQAIELTDVEPADGEVCVTSGWGDLWVGGPAPDQLQSVNVPIVNHAQCVELYDGHDITERMICAGLLEGGVDSCQGDSGGPLVSNGRQVGVVSWGVGCAYEGYPGIYSNIANQREWIREISGV